MRSKVIQNLLDSTLANAVAFSDLADFHAVHVFHGDLEVSLREQFAAMRKNQFFY